MGNLTEQELKDAHKRHVLAEAEKLAFIGRAADALVLAAIKNGVSLEDILPLTIALARQRAKKNKYSIL